jgi:ABC-type nitrate/sulfonate/bicarbonate transport system permease component
VVARTQTRHVRTRLSSWLLRGMSILLVFALWEWAGTIPVSIAFPSFTDTMDAFVEMLADGTFASAYAETIGPLIVGILLTALGGIVAGLVMGLSGRAEWLALPLFIVLPAASGLIFAGLRLGLAQGFTGAVLAELLITPTGLGDLITFYRAGADYSYMFATIFSIVLFASVTLTLLQRVEHRLFRPEMRAV